MAKEREGRLEHEYLYSSPRLAKRINSLTDAWCNPMIHLAANEHEKVKKMLWLLADLAASEYELMNDILPNPDRIIEY